MRQRSYMFLGCVDRITVDEAVERMHCLLSISERVTPAYGDRDEIKSIPTSPNAPPYGEAA